ncbi:MAG: hypothetical protein ACE366_11065 [Bradymonadia bacterium]
MTWAHTAFAGGEHVVSTKFVHLSTHSADQADHTFYGAGLMYEFPLVHHVVEMEFAVEGLVADGVYATPVDVRLKVPFHLNRNTDLYVGAGAVADTVYDHGDTRVYPGMVSTVGAYLWSADTLGVVLEVDYLVISEERTVHEIESGIGVAYRY